MVNGCVSPKNCINNIGNNYLYYAVNCEEDPLIEIGEVPADGIMHGRVFFIDCEHMCNDTRMCNDGTWIGTCPSTYIYNKYINI